MPAARVAVVAPAGVTRSDPDAARFPRSRRNAAIPAAHTAATTARPTGRVRPAREASRPAVSQRPVSRA